MNLDELLASHGMSMRRLVRSGGPPPETLARWRRGGCIPRRPTIARLASVLGLDVQVVADAVLETIAEARARRAAEERTG